MIFPKLHAKILQCPSEMLDKDGEELQRGECVLSQSWGGGRGVGGE